MHIHAHVGAPYGISKQSNKNRHMHYTRIMRSDGRPAMSDMGAAVVMRI